MNTLLRAIILFSFILISFKGATQDLSPGKNAISFDVTRYLVNEYNISLEKFITTRRSIEFSGGIIYQNTTLQNIFKGWNNSQIFYEEGFAARFHYKIFRRTDGDAKKWKDYISPGLIFKSLSYDNEEITTELKYDFFHRPYHETFLRDRKRIKAGIEFTWGKVYEAGRTFAFEFYYGAGINVNSVERTDHDRKANYDHVSDQLYNNDIPSYSETSLYVRPSVLAGIKIRLRF